MRERLCAAVTSSSKNCTSKIKINIRTEVYLHMYMIGYGAHHMRPHNALSSGKYETLNDKSIRTTICRLLNFDIRAHCAQD